MSDLPTGYRWATAEESESPPQDAIMVARTVDSSGRPYTQDEADLAVPVRPGHTADLAALLTRRYVTALDLRVCPRPIDRRIARALWLGACQAAHAAGYGRSPFEVQMVVIDPYQSRDGTRPGYNASNNAPQQAWDADLVATVATALAMIAQ